MTAAEFGKWVSRLPLEGTRGFRDSDVKRAYGDDYLKQFSKYVALGWLEQIKDSTVWWISNTGKLALLGGQPA